MNPFLQSLIAAAVRIALVWLAGHLGVQSTETEVASAALLIVAGIWTWYSWFKAHQFGVTSQSLNQATREEVKAVIAQGGAPSVLTPANEVPKV